MSELQFVREKPSNELFVDIQRDIDVATKLLPSKIISTIEAEELMPKFLVIAQRISNALLSFEMDIVEHRSLASCLYHDAIMNSDGGITEKKLKAETDPAYKKAREQVEYHEAVIYYLKTNYKIFENAHVSYRQISRNA